MVILGNLSCKKLLVVIVLGSSRYLVLAASAARLRDHARLRDSFIILYQLHQNSRKSLCLSPFLFRLLSLDLGPPRLILLWKLRLSHYRKILVCLHGLLTVWQTHNLWLILLVEYLNGFENLREYLLRQLRLVYRLPIDSELSIDPIHLAFDLREHRGLNVLSRCLTRCHGLLLL